MATGALPDDGAVPKSLVDAKGDLLVATANDTVARLAVGSNTHVLTADSAAATGVKWAAAGGGGGITKAFPHPIHRSLAAQLSTSLYLPISVRTGSVGSAASLPQQPRWWPYLIDRPMIVGAISTYCWTGEAGASLRCGLYSCDNNWLPVTLLADYGNMAGDTAGVKTITGGTTEVPAGMFLLCVWPSNHSTVRWSSPASAMPDVFGESSPASGAVSCAWRLQTETADYSAGLPSTISASIYGAGTTSVVAYVGFETP